MIVKSGLIPLRGGIHHTIAIAKKLKKIGKLEVNQEEDNHEETKRMTYQYI